MVSIESKMSSYLNGKAYIDHYRIADTLKKELTGEIVGTERENLLTEIKCFEFFFQYGELHPMIERLNDNGIKICYPDLLRFTDAEINYLKNRLNADMHPFPMSRYAHVLWLITRHNDFGTLAADAYKELIAMYFERSLEGQKLFHVFCDVIHCYHRVSVSIKYHPDECKAALLKWIKNDQLPVTWKDNILDIILASSLYKQADLQGLTSFMLSYLKGEKEDYFVTEKYLKSCLELAQREGVSNTEIFNLMGDNEMALALKREDDKSGMILIGCYQKASYYYRMAGNGKLYSEVSALYTEQKTKLKLSLFQHEFSADEVKIMNDEHNAIVEKMLSKKETSPLWYLVYNKNILMNEESLEAQARENMKGSFMYFATMQVYDQNNNVKILKDDAEKLAHQKFQIYSYHLQLSTLPVIEKLFYKGLKTGIFSRGSVMNFFNQTWLSRPLEAFTSDEKPETFSWMELLGPGLYEVISQIEAQILDKNFKPHYLLAIDTVSIKIEGVIRDLARLSGISVSKIKEGETSEMNLEELLREDAIIKIFTTEDILLWKFLLTRQGWNVRNNVAHSFYRPGDYARSKAIFLLLAVFRLCKYDKVGKNS